MLFSNQCKTIVLAVAAALVLAGCSGPDPHEPNELVGFDKQVSVEKVWTFSVGGSVTGLMVPAITEKAIYAAGENTLYAIEPKTGKKVWEVDTEADVTAGVGSDGNFIALGNVNGEVEVFDNHGKKLWKVKLPSEISTPPLVGFGFVIVKTSDTRVTAFDVNTGERRWRYQTQAPALTIRAAQEMKFSQAGVLIGQANGRLLALNSQGNVNFDVPVGNAKGTTEIERMIDVVGTPLVDAQMICAAAYQGNVRCLDLKEQKIAWTTPVDAVTGPVTDGKRVFVSAANGEIVCLDYATGKPLWVNKDYLWRSPSAQVVIGDWVAFGDYDGEISVLDPNTGATVGRTSISGEIKSAPLSMLDGALFQSSKGKLAYITLIRDDSKGLLDKAKGLVNWIF